MPLTFMSTLTRYEIFALLLKLSATRHCERMPIFVSQRRFTKAEGVCVCVGRERENRNKNKEKKKGRGRWGGGGGERGSREQERRTRRKTIQSLWR